VSGRAISRPRRSFSFIAWRASSAKVFYYGCIAPGVIAGRGAHRNGAVNVKATAANTPETKPRLQAHRLMSFIDRNGSLGQVACFDVSTL